MGREIMKIITNERGSLEHYRAIWGGRGGSGPGKIYWHDENPPTQY